MIKRLFWLGLGVAVGAIVVRQASKAVRAYSPAGLAGSARSSAVGLLDSVRDFIADVREGMAEREEQIQAAITHGISIEDLDAGLYSGLDEDGLDAEADERPDRPDRRDRPGPS